MSRLKEVSTRGKVPGMVKVDEEQVRGHLDLMVKTTVEQALNSFLEIEAKELCGAGRYERSPDRMDTRAGSYRRKLHTKAGEVTLKMPRLRTLPFETQIIERYKRREASVEESLVQMYLAGVSVRRVEDITEALWGMRVSPSAVSELNQKVYGQIEAWRNRKIEGEHPYVFLDGLWLKRTWGGEVRKVAVLVAIGVNADGHREILGICEGMQEDKESWLSFIRHLKSRGLSGVRLVVSDKCLGLVEAVSQCFPRAEWQRCVFHFHRNILSKVSREKMPEVAAMLKAIHAQEDHKVAMEKAAKVGNKLLAMRLRAAAEVLEAGMGEALTYMSFPREHWIRIRTNNTMERLNREIRRRTRVVGNFPDGQSAVMLVAARLRHVAATRWGSRRYLDMDRLQFQKPTKEDKTMNGYD
jgi:transposase-like protein